MSIGGSYGGVGVESIVGGTADAPYGGAEVTVAVGTPLPEVHGYLTDTTVYPLFNYDDEAMDFLSLFINNPYVSPNYSAADLQMFAMIDQYANQVKEAQRELDGVMAELMRYPFYADYFAQRQNSGNGKGCP